MLPPFGSVTTPRRPAASGVIVTVALPCVILVRRSALSNVYVAVGWPLSVRVWRRPVWGSYAYVTTPGCEAVHGGLVPFDSHVRLSRPSKPRRIVPDTESTTFRSRLAPS